MEQPVPIGLFTGPWLSFSETFIYDQVVMAEKTRPLVCARGTKKEGARFPYEPRCSLSKLEDVRYRISRKAPKFARFLRENGAQLLHAHFGTNGALALKLAAQLNLPLAVTFHGHDVAGLERANRFSLRYGSYQLLKAQLFSRSNLLLCASTDLAERLINEHGAPKSKVVVHFLGIDLRRFAPTERAPENQTILSVGRLVEKKGLEYALRAFSKLKSSLPNARYRIVGDGPLRASLEQMSRDLGLSSAVTFLGALSSSEVEKEMRAAAVLCCPSVVAENGDRESGVIVLKEAGATGLPTIGTWHGGIPEVIDDGITGYLVGEREVDSLADRLHQLLVTPDLRETMGRAAVEKMTREYDTRRQNERLENLLLGLL